MPSHQAHVYWLRHKNGRHFAYIVGATHGPPPRWATHHHQVPKDAALKAATAAENGSPDRVTVELCPCGQCSLGTYAKKHPHSSLAKRARAHAWVEHTIAAELEGS